MSSRFAESIMKIRRPGSAHRHQHGRQLPQPSLVGRRVRAPLQRGPAAAGLDHREALEDATVALVRDQEKAGLDIITDGRLHGDNYADQAVYYYLKRLGYDLKGGHLGFPIYSRLHAATLTPRSSGAAPSWSRRRGPSGAPPTSPSRSSTPASRCSRRHQRPPLCVQPRARHGPRRGHEPGRPRARRHGRRLHPVRRVTWPYFYEDWAIEAFNRVVEGVENAKVIVHVCWGNWGGTPAYSPTRPPRPARSSTSPSARARRRPPPRRSCPSRTRPTSTSSTSSPAAAAPTTSWASRS